MTYGISHLLIGGGIFRGRVKKKKEKILLCKEGHYMKNKNIGVCVFSTQPGPRTTIIPQVKVTLTA